MSPCFLEAYEKKARGEITEDEYLQHLLAHFRDAWHEQDELKPWDPPISQLKSVDLFGYTIWAWASKSLSISKDIKPLENVFRTYRSGDADEVAETLDALEKEDRSRATESLAALAWTDRRPDILKLCLDREFTYNGWFINAADSFERDEANANSDIAKILQASNFRRKWPLTKSKGANDENVEEDDPAAIFDAGGEYEVDW